MGKYNFTRTTKNNIKYLDLIQNNMIEHSNLLDKVWYVKDNQISEVTIVSKTRDSYYGTEKVIKIVKDNTLLDVALSTLFYTQEEACNYILDKVNTEISSVENTMNTVIQSLGELYNLRHSIEAVIKNLSKQ